MNTVIPVMNIEQFMCQKFPPRCCFVILRIVGIKNEKGRHVVRIATGYFNFVITKVWFDTLLCVDNPWTLHVFLTAAPSIHRN